MLKTKEYYICDRCKKEIDKDKINKRYDNMYSYELCDECSIDFDNYKLEIKRLENEYEEYGKLYKFGKYLPKDDEKVDE
jgi:hypothetical protein